MRNVIFLFAAVLLVGCARVPVSDQAALVQPARARAVADCEYLGFIGYLNPVGFGVEARLHNAKVWVRESAANLGADHIVWTNDLPGRLEGLGRAYRCD